MKRPEILSTDRRTTDRRKPPDEFTLNEIRVVCACKLVLLVFRPMVVSGISETVHCEGCDRDVTLYLEVPKLAVANSIIAVRGGGGNGESSHA